MRFLIIPVLVSAAALAQSPAKVITFNRADSEHCKVVVAGGKPLLESTYQGISVAIAMPVSSGNGDLLVFVAIAQTAGGIVQVDPKDIYGLYSDAAHSRFSYYDKNAEVKAQGRGPAGDPSLSASNAGLDPGEMRPGQVLGGGAPSGGGPPGPDSSGGGSAAAGKGAPIPPTYLHKSKVKPGDKVAGWVVLRQTNGAKLEVHATDMLDEVDIPVNGVVFRF